MPRPGMSDGRVFTNYLPNCQLNNMVQSENKFSNNVEYKHFIQSNSEKVRNNFVSSAPAPVSGCGLPGSTISM